MIIATEVTTDSNTASPLMLALHRSNPEVSVQELFADSFPVVFTENHNLRYLIRQD